MEPSKTPFGDALKKLEQVPKNTAAIGGVAKQGGEKGLTGEVSTDIGKPGGWSFAAAGELMKKAGWSVAGMFRWQGRS